jgi:hypothetical protein
MDDDTLAGDLALEPEDAEHVTGGVKIACHACNHLHNQTDPKCNPQCLHGAAVGYGMPGNVRNAY